MKPNKFAFIFTLLIIFININVVRAEDLIASCNYIDKVNGGNITLNITKDFIISNDISLISQVSSYCSTNWKKEDSLDGNKFSCAGENDNTGYSTIYANLNINVAYGDFVEKGEFECNNLKKIYLKLDAIPSGRGVTLNYSINKSKSDKSTEYVLDSTNSKVYISNPESAEQLGDWAICHYNNNVLKFNKTQYQTVINGEVSPIENYDSNTGIGKLIVENQFSCPIQLCNRTFTNEKTSGCIYSADFSGGEFTCGAIKLYMVDFDAANDNYKKTKDIEELKNRNEAEDKLKSFCSIALANNNYNDINNCVKDCLILNDKIIERKDEQVLISQCGFSTRVILFVARIIKWVRYIVPVLVIVLGILDFIKAIGADKEDEMKKAQGRFIKRLIAAALIFLIPLIIGFVLEVTGFNVTGCGIIDL